MINDQLKAILSKGLADDKVLFEIKKIIAAKDATEREYLDIVNQDETKERVIEHIRKGGEPGVFLGYRCLDREFMNNSMGYTMKLGLCTDWGGFPSMGKTTFLNQLLINTSVLYGWKHLMFVPDAGSEEEVYADLIWMHTGKTYDRIYPNRISDSEASESYDWLRKYFFVLVEKDFKMASYESILQSAYRLQYQFTPNAQPKTPIENGFFQTLTIDSWKDIKKKYERGETPTDYLARMLSRRNKLSSYLNLHSHTIIHPSKPEKDSRGDPPSSYDYMGGSEWYNNAKSQMTYHRDKTLVPDYRSPMSNVCELYSLKQKPKIVGVEGSTNLFRYSIPENRFYELSIDGSRVMKPRSREEVIREVRAHNASNSIPDNRYEVDNEDTFLAIKEDAPF